VYIGLRALEIYAILVVINEGGRTMKKKDVELGKIYTVKVSGRIVPVRILRLSPYGGWVGQNLITTREVHIKTAGRLRGEWIR
jgi:hypothetical protein